MARKPAGRERRKPIPGARTQRAGPARAHAARSETRPGLERYLGSVIRSLRQRDHLTIADVASQAGISPGMLFTPPEVRAMDDKLGKPVTTTEFTLPAMLKKAERHQKRMLLLDGLSNTAAVIPGHTAAFSALSGMVPANGTAAGNGGYVNYIFGHHGSIIDPSCSTPPVGPDPLLCGATTMEMQQQTVFFAASNGAGIRVVNGAVIQP